MRQARIKVSPTEGAAIYHCISRTVNGEWLFDDTAREVLRSQLWRIADYCGIRILTYAILANHFHLLLLVPRQAPVSDSELLRRYRTLYLPRNTSRHPRLDALVAHGGQEAESWRKRQLALMGDVSTFMKLLKQRFSIWFNKAHGRFGTLWAERFKSVLIDPNGRVCQAIATYIDLNAVRAGLVADPKDYRFCGYAEAVAGSCDARAGICAITGQAEWSQAQASHREMIFSVGARPRENAASIPAAALERVMAEGGRIPLGDALRCRIRYFTEGAVLGTRAFVQDQLAQYHPRSGWRRDHEPCDLPPWTDWDGWATLRRLRSRPTS